MRPFCRFSLLLGLLTSALTPAYALDFKIIPDDGFGQRVLFVFDCYMVAEGKGCTTVTNHFSEDDEKRLQTAWTGQIQEVWLISGGGDLDTGIAMAQVFRSRGATVRVPSNARLLRAGYHLLFDRNCISACTVAFMGGQFRFIDPDATYEVHAGSSVSWNDLDDKDLLQYIRGIMTDTRTKGLRAVASNRTRKDRQYARDIFTVFQESLWLPVQDESTAAGRLKRQNDQRQRDGTLASWVRDGLDRGYTYDAAQLTRDQKLLELEGDAALQDILMRIERDSMDQAIRDLRSMLPLLGPRADAALAMLTAMYDTSSIKETNRIPRETLLKMGYVTELVR